VPALLDSTHVAALDERHADTDEEEHLALLHAVVVELVMDEECERELKAGVKEKVEELR